MQRKTKNELSLIDEAQEKREESLLGQIGILEWVGIAFLFLLPNRNPSTHVKPSSSYV